MYIRTSLFVSFIFNTEYDLHEFRLKLIQYSILGLLTHNATWCQNRGCICISSTRRTYGRIHATSCIHPVIQTTTRIIILWTELFPKERRERRSKERFFKDLKDLHSSSNPRVFPVFLHAIHQPTNSFPSFQLESKSVSSVSTRNPATYKLILYPELILQEIQELQGSFCAGTFQQLLPMHPSTLQHPGLPRNRQAG